MSTDTRTCEVTIRHKDPRVANDAIHTAGRAKAAEKLSVGPGVVEYRGSVQTSYPLDGGGDMHEFVTTWGIADAPPPKET